jgi:hypothetical protein
MADSRLVGTGTHDSLVDGLCRHASLLYDARSIQAGRRREASRAPVGRTCPGCTRRGTYRSIHKATNPVEFFLLVATDVICSISFAHGRAVSSMVGGIQGHASQDGLQCAALFQSIPACLVARIIACAHVSFFDLLPSSYIHTQHSNAWCAMREGKKS